ncbi:hypothetical protein CRG98_040105 [Punica granatum]|uniref:Paf1 complex subunit Cdc73 N-terminal domain-containing protein n=1 Tax=Punica granatum TaxID=22663 RepID=A0A2I0I7W3_PUNGR|nr:hypothetical protein CRG98_040105 [Punica granatum]
MDPLSALRDFTIRGELDKIVRFGDEFRFGSDYAFPCTAETAYRSKQGNLYTLETLVFYVKNHQLKHTEYIQSARTQQIPSVTFIDRKPLLEYLQGKVSLEGHLAPWEVAGSVCNLQQNHRGEEAYCRKKGGGGSRQWDHPLVSSFRLSES